MLVRQMMLRVAARVRLGAFNAFDDRGDVPGWVLITLMTAGIVAVLWGVAEGDLKNIFDSAVNSVKAPSGN